MPAPLIAVTTSRIRNAAGSRLVCVPDAYVQAIIRAGGIPVLVPARLSESQLHDLSSQVHGLLLTGGGDLNPALFNGKPHPRVYDIDADRDQLELKLVRLAVQDGLPFFGICRGVQVINVALGGTLYTDLADQLPGALKHDYFPDSPRDYLAHPVRVEPGSQLAGILGDTQAQVNSLHHQGIEQVAPGLTATAWAPDRLVEAIEFPGHPFGLGVQWHPECLPDSLAMQALFRAFVQSAARVSP